MATIILVSLFLGLAVSAYREARRAGIWSWKSFLWSTAVLAIVGVGVGFIAAWAGRRSSGEHAAGIALTAGGIIVAAVFGFALIWKRRRR